MTIAVCIPTRGRPELLKATVDNLLATSTLKSTRIVIGADEDDANILRLPSMKVLTSVKPREDTMGEKWTRCANAVPKADLYVQWCDDTILTTMGWDWIMRDAYKPFGSRAGFLYFAGNIQGALAPGIAVTRKFIDIAGYFTPPYFPFWWCDTWLDEIARFSGHILHLPIEGKLLQGGKNTSRGLKEIAFWADFFQKTRWMRKDIAQRILMGDPRWRHRQMLAFWPELEKQLDARDSRCRDPNTAAQFEREMGFDPPKDDDPRYLRVKENALKMLREMQK